MFIWSTFFIKLSNSAVLTAMKISIEKRFMELVMEIVRKTKTPYGYDGYILIGSRIHVGDLRGQNPFTDNNFDGKAFTWDFPKLSIRCTGAIAGKKKYFWTLKISVTVHTNMKKCRSNWCLRTNKDPYCVIEMDLCPDQLNCHLHFTHMTKTLFLHFSKVWL